LLAAAKVSTIEIAYRRFAWLPVTALLLQFLLAKPILSHLSYLAIVPSGTVSMWPAKQSGDRLDEPPRRATRLVRPGAYS
jgi:hypothetical protein